MDEGGNPDQFTASTFKASLLDNQVRARGSGDGGRPAHHITLLSRGGGCYNEACCCCAQVSKGRVLAIKQFRENLMADVEQLLPEEAAEYRWVATKFCAAAPLAMLLCE